MILVHLLCQINYNYRWIRKAWIYIKIYIVNLYKDIVMVTCLRIFCTTQIIKMMIQIYAFLIHHNYKVNSVRDSFSDFFKSHKIAYYKGSEKYIFFYPRTLSQNWGKFSSTALVIDTFYVKYCFLLKQYLKMDLNK